MRSLPTPLSPRISTVVSVSAMLSTMERDRKSTRLNSSHANISYAVFCLKKKKPPILYTPPILRDLFVEGGGTAALELRAAARLPAVLRIAVVICASSRVELDAAAADLPS